MMISFAFFSAARFASSSILLMILEASKRGLVFQVLQQYLLGLVGGHAGDALELLLVPLELLPELLLLLLVFLLLDLLHLFLLVDLVEALVYGLFFLQQALFDVLELLPPVAALLLHRVLFFQQLVLGFEEQLLPLVLGVLDGVLDDPLRLGFGGAQLYLAKICAKGISHNSNDRESNNQYNCQYCHIGPPVPL